MIPPDDIANRFSLRAPATKRPYKPMKSCSHGARHPLLCKEFMTAIIFHGRDRQRRGAAVARPVPSADGRDAPLALGGMTTADSHYKFFQFPPSLALRYGRETLGAGAMKEKGTRGINIAVLLTGYTAILSGLVGLRTRPIVAVLVVLGGMALSICSAVELVQ